MKRLNIVIFLILMFFIQFDSIIMKQNFNQTSSFDDDDDDGEELILTETEIDHQRNARMMMMKMMNNQTLNHHYCDDGWISFKNKCYFFHNDMIGANIHEAINICERYHHSHLLQIDSIDETRFLRSYLFEKLELKFSIWLSLIRKNSTHFMWLNNRRPLYRLNNSSSSGDNNNDDDDDNNNHWSSFTYWAPNEPNNLNSKHYCVVMSSEKQDLLFGRWYDVTCSDAFLVVCEHSNNNSDDKNNQTKSIISYENDDGVTRSLNLLDSQTSDSNVDNRQQQQLQHPCHSIVQLKQQYPDPTTVHFNHAFMIETTDI
nr:uncharacterized protein LOC124490268 [Dermatophagoides farinae]